ncbi:MAG: prepilin-type N-terminal cleavage/methylation domain-containing protein, partial [Candidatus Omnitrophota bacterium]|nr:prepilin-type N-terminal cleavage/methylation domain-containing protein [Candidatus Omnitrophota bacterium]
MIIRPDRGFTLIEVMGVVCIVGLIFAIAVPGYFKFNKTSKAVACVANLERIDAAIDQWALDNYVQAGTSISGSGEDIYSDYVRGGTPKCPEGGEYTLHAVGVNPQVTCS